MVVLFEEENLVFFFFLYILSPPYRSGHLVSGLHDRPCKLTACEETVFLNIRIKWLAALVLELLLVWYST